MLSKCLNCRDKRRKERCYKYKKQPNECFICKVVIKEKDRNDHMSKHYNEAELYLTCSMSKLNQHIYYFRFKTNKCRFCVYLHRYRFSRTRERFKEHVKIYIFEVKIIIFGYTFY